MKTDLAKSLLDYIAEREKFLNSVAANSAVEYADTDNKSAQATFMQYKFAAEQLSQLRTITINTLHGIERLIPGEKA